MLRKQSRKVVKQALGLARVKLIYSRITLTKFTSLYFFTALLTCIVLSVLQGVTYYDNFQARDLVQSLRESANINTTSLVVEVNGHLEMCKDFPGRADANCTRVWRKVNDGSADPRGLSDLVVDNFPRDHDDSDDDDDDNSHVGSAQSTTQRGATINSADVVRVDTEDGQVALTQECVQSLHWFSDLVRDSKREDILTLAFEIWLLSISIVAILNESLPHLFAALAAHVIGTSWAAFRAGSSKNQERMYHRLIVNGACGRDILGGWWTQRHNHTYIIIGFNLLALVLCAYLTFRLYKVYSAHSFRLAGESPLLHAAYKRVLFLSVLLQLSGFFVLGAVGLWIDKISSGEFRAMSRHFSIYLAVFIIIAIVDIPWLVVGWVSVRRENRGLFWLFAGLSLVMLAGPTFMFSSELYRFVFGIWPFFAVMTVSAYVLTVATIMAAVACRLQFGIGLPAYLKRTEEPEGHDFTPVVLTQKQFKRSSRDSNSSELEKGYLEKSKYDQDVVEINALPYIQPPKAARQAPIPRGKLVQPRGPTLSVYSDPTRATLKLSTTPPVARGPMSAVDSESQSVISSKYSFMSGTSAAPSTKPSPPVISVPPMPSRAGLPTNPRPNNYF